MPNPPTPYIAVHPLQPLPGASKIACTTPDITSSTASETGADLIAAQYHSLRKRLERLNSEDEKDASAIDQTIDRLALVQRDAKAANGLFGNNPTE